MASEPGLCGAAPENTGGGRVLNQRLASCWLQTSHNPSLATTRRSCAPAANAKWESSGCGTHARDASQSPMLRVIARLTGLPPPEATGEHSRRKSRWAPMYDLRSVAAGLLCG